MIIDVSQNITPQDILSIRKKLGLSQKTLETLANVHTYYVGQVERRATSLSPKLMQRIRAALIMDAHKQHLRSVVVDTPAPVVTYLKNTRRRSFMPAMNVAEKDRRSRKQGAVNPATGKELRDISNAPSSMGDRL